MAVPLLSPLQVMSVEFVFIINTLGSDILYETDELQPDASVIVAEYTPAHKLLIVLVVCPLLLQEMLYGLFPPVPFTVNCPVQIPLHVSETEETICAVTPLRLFMVTEPFTWQPFESVTVTE